MDLSEICRVCVEEVNSFWCLFETNVTLPADLTPALIISTCAGTRIDRKDGLPESVCYSCLQAMVAAYRIREKCISSDRKLRKILLHNKPSIMERTASAEIKTEPNLCEIEIIQQTEAIHETEAAYGSVNEEDDCSDNIGTESDYVDGLVALQQELLQPEYCDEEYLINDSLEQPDGYAEDGQQSLVADNTTDAEVPLEGDVSEEISTVEYTQDFQSANRPKADDSSKRFTCDICEKRFTTKGNLKAHVHLHNNYKPYRCEVCGDEFSRKHNYNVHKMRHSGKRTHQCSVCEKSFVCAVNLKNHMVTHSNVKPFKCGQCGKEFGYRTDLVRHEIRHTGVYPFACGNCQHKFSRKTSLNRHLLRCTGPKKERKKKRPLS